MKNLNKKNVALLILTISCLFLMVFQISLVKGATHTELTINDEKSSQRLGTSDTEKLYYIDAPEGKITIRVFDIMVISGLEVTLKVASDENYVTILGTGTNAGKEEVSVEVELTSQTRLYINVTKVSGTGYFDIIVSDSSGSMMLILFIALAAGIGGLAVVAMVTGIKSSKEKIAKMKFELDTDRPIDQTYKFLLKTYSGINNLSILNAVENKSIETELTTIGVGYYTSTHSTSGGGSYNTTRPYTYTIRYSAKVSFDKKDGKTSIKMELKPGKMYRGVMISVIMFLIFGVAMGGMFIAIGGIGVEFLQGFGFIMFIVMGLISLLMALLMPRVTVKQYKRTANDQFQLLVKKPVIALQLGTEEAKAAVQFTQVTKTEAKQQSDVNFCPYCGKGINPGAKYCEGCGSEIV